MSSRTAKLCVTRLKQNSLADLSRAFLKVETQNYIAQFKFKLLEAAPKQFGEAKFIFSESNKNEDYRIDFIYGYDICRMTMRKIPFPSVLKLVVGQEYNVRVIVSANHLKLFVDDMLIIQNINFGTRSDGFIGFGTWNASALFSEIAIYTLKTIECFIIMPFDEKRNFLYDFAILPALASHPSLVIKYMRADRSLTMGKISEEISEYIISADIVIADITENNANVFYELGLTHANNKKALLLTEKSKGRDSEIPFDIRDFRYHSYEFSKEGFENIRNKIQDVLTNFDSQNK